MADGAKIHRKLQSEAGGYYNSEVELSCTMLLDGVYYTVRGRADGVIRTEKGITVDEIKCVKGSYFFEPPREIFLAQVKCYAYFLCVRDELSEIGGRITYYNIDNGKTKYFNYHFTATELNGFFVSLLKRIKRRAMLCIKRQTEVLPQARRAVFPYKELREGQEIMIRESYRAIKRGKRLFIEAPTGTGKTISSLFPSVRALGDGRADKIFYLTAKASTRREAYRAASDIYKAGVQLRTVVVSAKEQLCMCSAKKLQGGSKNYCNGCDCENANGYYDRIEDAIFELIDGGNGYPRNLICEVARKHRVCPYELSLDLSELCDIIICDYNYAFDPSVYFRRYFSENRGENYIFLIDEAHNLVDRARAMYSAKLCRKAFEDVISLFEEIDSEPISYCEGAIKAFLHMRSLCKEELVRDASGEERGFFVAREPISSFNEAMELFKKKSEIWIKKHRDHPSADAFNLLVSDVRKFLLVNEYFDKGFLTYVQIFDGDVSVETCCLDPSPIMNSLLNRAKASILFSATLTPAAYFCDVLGGGKKAQSIALPSPFDTDNLCIAVADYVSTRYSEREKNAPRFASILAASVISKKGNYIAYFPSYECLEEVHKIFKRKYPNVETVVQQRNMTLKEKEEFLAAFKNDEGHLRIGFCVLGGAFSEGVDLPGSQLIGAIIFGVGLPGLSNERNMIRDYIDPEGIEGYDYAYTYPGMNNVLQAAGRVIRRDDDRGIVVLADDRYATPKYRALFPEHWKNIRYAGNSRSLCEIIRRFWNDEK
jgi:Rad3-related DNA helicase